MVGAGGVGIADRVDHEGGEVDVVLLDGSAGVEAGEQQQVLDQAGHPGGLGLDPGHRVLDVVGQVVAGAAGQLGVAADRGQGSAQLVAGVGDELAYPHLACLACGERGRDVAEQAVERRADLADFGAGVGVLVRNALAERDLAAVELELGDASGGLGDAAQRPQGEPHDDRRRGGRRRAGPRC